MHRRLVGRTGELASIQAHLDRAIAGHGSLVLVAGEPGIGKTRLAEEVVAVGDERGAMTAWGRCWEVGGAPPYWAWAEALRGLGDHVGREPLADAIRETAALAQLLPELAADDSRARVDEGGARFQLYEAFARLLVVAAGIRPVVIVLDDVHAADHSSLLLLQFVAGRLDDLRVLVVATYRDTEVTKGHHFSATLGQLLRERSTARVTVGGLDVEGVSELILATTGTLPSSRTAARVREQTDGNPLYVREVTRLLAQDGRLEDIDDLLLPQDIRETVLARVARLPEVTKAALSTAAVLGREFAIDVLVSLAGPDVLDHLEPAAADHLIAGASTRLGHLRFAHALVAQALYDDVAPGRRMQLHLAAAEALERRNRADPDAVLSELAHHYCAAIPVVAPEVAVECSRRAGDQAVRLLAFEEGIRLYRRALSVLGASPSADVPARLDLLLQLGDAQTRAGDTDAAAATFLDAAALARAHGDGTRLAQAAVGYGGRFVWLRAGRDVHLVPLLEEALEVLTDDDSVLRSRAAARLAGARRDDIDRTHRERLSEEALAMARRLGDPETLAAAIAARFTAIWGPDSVVEEMRLSEEMERVTAGGDPEREGDSYWLRFIATMTNGDAETPRAYAARYRAPAHAMRQPSQHWYTGVMRSILALITGPLDGVEELLEETRSSGQTAHTSDADASYRFALLELRRLEGRLHEVADEARAGLSEFPGYRTFRAWNALIAAVVGQPDVAREEVRKMLEGGDSTVPRDNGWLAAMWLLGDATIAIDDQDLARIVYRRLEPYGHLVALAHGEVVRGAVSLALGTLAMTLGDFGAAAAHLDRALEAHQRMRADVLVAQTLYAQGVLLERRGGRGDQAGAAALFARVQAEAHRLGLGDLERRLSQGDGRKRRPGGLTQREQEVASLVAGGLSNRAIAGELVLSERTVETHVQNILTKLGFTSRAQVAGWAVANGLSVPAT